MGILIFGSINVDHLMKVQRISRPGETNIADDLQIFFGGKGANQAVAAARAGTKINTDMVGAIGHDGLADDVLANFVQNGVGVKHIVRADTQTGSAYIFVSPDGENAITIVAGANAKLRAQNVPDELLEKTSILVFQMEVPVGENLALAQKYKSLKPDGQILLNLAPAPLEDFDEHVNLLLDLTDILVMNEHEALRALQGACINVSKIADDNARELASFHNAIVIITLGSKGAIAALGNGECIKVPSPKIVPVDSTGAGDTFVGVLATGLAEEKSLLSSLKTAACAGALACMKTGAQAGMPDAVALERFQDKWLRLSGSKTRQNKDLEHGF